jgi:hypothetical protein
MPSLYNFGVASKVSISSLFFNPSHVDYNFGFASKVSISKSLWNPTMCYGR